MGMDTSGSQGRVFKKVLQILGLILAWGWALVIIIGGLGLIIIRLGPWPRTNGWFALFSGLAACPLTAWILRRYGNITFPAWLSLIRLNPHSRLIVAAIKEQRDATVSPHFPLARVAVFAAPSAPEPS